ncbi:MAG: hypothetical protein K2G55_01735, partial [Lachnospiraceae bacterium]|nr:hypothetical protein [Lachnospiraceae bacterium]
MTRDDFKKQSDELFFQIRKSLCQKIVESAKPIYDKAEECPDKTSALHYAANELSCLMSTLS